MLTIAQSTQRIKDNLQHFLPEHLVDTLCQQIPRSFRQRKLSPQTTTYLFVQQLLHGNVAAGELPHLSGLDFTESAYCQARQRLPVGYFYRLQHAVAGRSPTPRRWYGHRLFYLDGSSFSMPDTEELQQEFGQPDGQKDGCGFPSAHLLTLFEHSTGTLLHALASPYRTHDLAQARHLHWPLQAGDVLLGDRAFCSYAHIALLRKRNIHGLFRAHQKTIINFRPGRRHAAPAEQGPHVKGLPRSRWVKRLGKNDQLVEYYKPKEKPDWMSPEEYDDLPEKMLLRELRITVKVPGCRSKKIILVTTLTGAKKYSARALAKLYRRRWQAEVNLRHLKQTLKLDVLRCQTLVGVMKELLLIVVLYNLVRQVMHQAASRQEVAVERISFVDALRWLRWRARGQELPRLKVNPDRPNRVEPREVKRRPKSFKLLTQPRRQRQKDLLKQGSAP